MTAIINKKRKERKEEKIHKEKQEKTRRIEQQSTNIKLEHEPRGIEEKGMGDI